MTLLAPLATAEHVIERVTTAVPFPRGMVMIDGELYVLARGRVRGAGGVSAAVNDRAGTLFVVDPNVSEGIDKKRVSAAVQRNGKVFAEPTSPPFKLWDRKASPPESDRETDRPYCTLRYHEQRRAFTFAPSAASTRPGRRAKLRSARISMTRCCGMTCGQASGTKWSDTTSKPAAAIPITTLPYTNRHTVG